MTLKALAKDPRDRYASVLDLADEVRAYLEGGRLQSVDYSPLELAVKWARRHRTAAALTATALVATVAILGVLWWSAAERAATLAQGEQELLEQRQELEDEKRAAVAAEQERTDEAQAQAEFEFLLAKVEPLVMRGNRGLLTETGPAGGVDVRATLRALERQFPDRARGSLITARFHHRLFAHAEAARLYRRAIEQAVTEERPALADRARYHLAMLLLESNERTPLAPEVFELLERIDPERSPGAHHTLASALAALRATSLRDHRVDAEGRAPPGRWARCRPGLS